MLPLLTEIMRTPERARGLSECEWDLLVRQARHANLLGRMHHLLDGALGADGVPERPARHLRSAATMAARQHLSVRHEVSLLRDSLVELGRPMVLLKGAAYVAGSLPAATGRVFADIDILLPHELLGQAESELMVHGWSAGSLDSYDQRYYRRWMHEIPPLQHMFRGTTLDVHHTLLPPTGRQRMDPALLLRASLEIPGLPGVHMLAPVDMVLHSAAHMFHEGESDNLLRDLSDIDLLLRHFGAEQDFWPRLADRADQLHLAQPLRLALRYSGEVMGTPVPEDCRRRLGAGRSLSWQNQALDFIYRRSLRPMHESCGDGWSRWCRRALYVRAHWLRMSPPLLAYHLAHKALWPARTVSLEGPQRPPA